MIRDPDAGREPGREVYVQLGRGEQRSGRPLDSLLAAYRVGARVAWRRIAAAGRRAELEAEPLTLLAEAIFAYIDELSADSVEGYAEAQAEVEDVRRRRRRELVAAARLRARGRARRPRSRGARGGLDAAEADRRRSLRRGRPGGRRPPRCRPSRWHVLDGHGLHPARRPRGPGPSRGHRSSGRRALGLCSGPRPSSTASAASWSLARSLLAADADGSLGRSRSCWSPRTTSPT